MNFAFPRSLKPLGAPLLVLGAAGIALAAGAALPPSLAGLKVYGPYAVLLFGAAISLWFNRGRAFVALASLLAAYTGHRFALDADGASFAARAVLSLSAVFVPLNILLATLLPERGVLHYRNYRWLLLFAAEALFTAWVSAAGRSPVSGLVWQQALEQWPLKAAPAPALGLALMAGALVAAGLRAWPRRPPLEIGTAGAVVALLIASLGATSPGVYTTFLTAAGMILTLALLQESHRMAFRDELTGLPSRRALEERLLALGPVYTLAMVDVDHFKRFNDSYGHDVGDQVLKLVGAHLAEARGEAFRYGGEEFTVLFTGRTLDEAMPELEAMRAEIEGYHMAIRAKDRPKDAETGRGRRSGESPHQTVSVTISVGVAQPSPRHTKAHEVLRAADKALYRAKEAGRNRVSR